MGRPGRPKVKDGERLSIYISKEAINIIDSLKGGLSTSEFVNQIILNLDGSQLPKYIQKVKELEKQLKALQVDYDKLLRDKERLEKKLQALQVEEEESIEKVLFSAKERKEMQREKVLRRITRQLRAALESTEEWRAPLKKLCEDAGLDYDMVRKIFWRELVNTYVESRGMRMWYDKSIEVKKQGEEPWLYLDGWWERAHKKDIELLKSLLVEGKKLSEVARDFYLQKEGREPGQSEWVQLRFEYWGDGRVYMKPKSRLLEGWLLKRVKDGKYYDYVLVREDGHAEMVQPAGEVLT